MIRKDPGVRIPPSPPRYSINPLFVIGILGVSLKIKSAKELLLLCHHGLFAGRRTAGAVARIAPFGDGTRVGERFLPGAGERDHRIVP